VSEHEDAELRRRVSLRMPGDPAAASDAVRALEDALPDHVDTSGVLGHQALAGFIANALAMQGWMLVHRSETFPSLPSDAVRAALDLMNQALDHLVPMDGSEASPLEVAYAIPLLIDARAALRLPAAAPVDAELLARAMHNSHASPEWIIEGDITGKEDAIARGDMAAIGRQGTWQDHLADARRYAAAYNRQSE